MTDTDRAEQAFRDALSAHAVEAPSEIPPLRPRRRASWLVGLAAAAAVVAAAVVVPLVVSNQKAPEDTPVVQDGGRWQWIGLRDVEVQAPAAWGYAYEAIRPDCIDPNDLDGGWAKDVPTAPYVTLGTPNRPVPLVGCFREPQPGDPDPAFGPLPFALWQPYVKLDLARPDLEYADRRDGAWHYRDWQLTRRTFGGVQITVLAPPDNPDLGDHVLTSVRTVVTTVLGCDPASTAQAVSFAEPVGPPVPAAADVAAVAVCEYSRRPGQAGLEGSRLITGRAARELVEAIHQAPAGGGPDHPQNCSADMYGDRAIALRFFGSADDTTSPTGEAYVYFDWCFGNGIVDADGARQLTRADCSPLFGRAPVGLWSASMGIADVCGPFGR